MKRPFLFLLIAWLLALLLPREALASFTNHFAAWPSSTEQTATSPLPENGWPEASISLDLGELRLESRNGLFCNDDPVGNFDPIGEADGNDGTESFGSFLWNGFFNWMDPTRAAEQSHLSIMTGLYGGKAAYASQVAQWEQATQDPIGDMERQMVHATDYGSPFDSDAFVRNYQYADAGLQDYMQTRSNIDAAPTDLTAFMLTLYGPGVAGRVMQLGDEVLSAARDLQLFTPRQPSANSWMAPSLHGSESGSVINPLDALFDNTPNAEAKKLGFTFRGDTRKFNSLFSGGFTAKGSNLNLLEHALGNPKPPSAYIATSESFETAASRGNYIYVVRPIGGIDVNQILGPLSPNPDEMEIAVPFRIAPNDIRAVTLPDQGKSLLNPNWRP